MLNKLTAIVSGVIFLCISLNSFSQEKKELREKMGDLYSKVASSYDKPSANELENLELIEKEMASAKKVYDKLLKKIDLNNLNLKSYDEFISK